MEDNNPCEQIGWESMKWIHLSLVDREKWQALADVATNLLVS
jgi:hypothetical protein